MKSFIFLLSLLAFAISSTLPKGLLTNDETHGCIVDKQEGRCCWMNNNGCCKPGINQICTQAFRLCCKTKVFDPTTKKYKYTYN